MSDISYTAGNVLADAATIVEAGTAGAAVTAGMPVFQDPTDSNKWKPCRANASATANAGGIALNSASAGQPISVAKPGGEITYGSGLTQGVVYVVSAAAAGGVAPSTDLASGNYVTPIGVAKSASVLKFGVINSATTKP